MAQLRRNEREAIQIAGAKQFNIMKKAVGLGSKDPAPTVRAFQKTFDVWIDQDIEDEGTRDFYKVCYQRLVDCPYTVDVCLDALDERTIEKFKTWALALKSVKTKTTVNRYLATLSKALHYAADKLKLIDKLPKIHKYPSGRPVNASGISRSPTTNTRPGSQLLRNRSGVPLSSRGIAACRATN